MILPTSSSEDERYRSNAPAPIALGLNRSDLVIEEIVFVGGLGTFFALPVLVLWIFEPQAWRAWLLFVLGALLTAAVINSTPRSIYACLRRRPPVVIAAEGISLKFRETIPWSAVSGLYVDDENLSLQLTADEMDRRGWDPVQCMATRRVHFDVPLSWIDAEPSEIMSHARPFLTCATNDG
jgi:hypothetical protein